MKILKKFQDMFNKPEYINKPLIYIDWANVKERDIEKVIELLEIPEDTYNIKSFIDNSNEVEIYVSFKLEEDKKRFREFLETKSFWFNEDDVDPNNKKWDFLIFSNQQYLEDNILLDDNDE